MLSSELRSGMGTQPISSQRGLPTYVTWCRCKEDRDTMSYATPHLSPHLIAKSLDELRTWRLPEGTDFVGAHRGVLRAMVATEALAGLELPLDLSAPRLEDA